MNKEEKILLDKVACFFEEKIFDKHKLKTSKEHSTLKSYNFNPILVKYLSKILDDKITPVGIAKALYFPRVLGTSINTSFGTNFQNMLVKLELVDGSLHDGMDIEFIDKIDKRKKWCQLKSGPNTINSGDVSPIIDKFSKLANRARQNLIEMNNTTDLIVGVLYGSEDQLSQHYRKINEKHPVYIGRELWQRITGYPNFYDQLVIRLDMMIQSIDSEEFFKQGYLKLAKEIEKSDHFNFN